MSEAAFLGLSLDFYKYASMPVISAAVGYVTNVVAIRMMFRPLEFRGLLAPYLGWQGIVPRKAAKMAGISVDTITAKLISEEEIFARLDPQRMSEELKRPMLALIEDIIDAVMQEYHPDFWDALPAMVKRRIVRRIQAEAPAVIADVMAEVRANVDQIFDLKYMAVTRLVRDKTLLNRIFLETGREEFIFIGRSGLYFGFLFGFMQMLVWLFYTPWWLLPLFGMLVGYTTNWVALKMIFNPKRAHQFGPWRVQGLFHKRQAGVARDYGDLVADKILTPENILEAVLKGPYSDKLFALVARHVEAAIDESASVAKPFVSWTAGTPHYAQMKASAVDRVIARMPAALGHITDYAADAMQIRESLVERLQRLDAVAFERMLRPAFEEDEWILIAVGAVLGFTAGWFQLIVLFGDEFSAAFGG